MDSKIVRSLDRRSAAHSSSNIQPLFSISCRLTLTRRMHNNRRHYLNYIAVPSRRIHIPTAIIAIISNKYT